MDGCAYDRETKRNEKKKRNKAFNPNLIIKHKGQKKSAQTTYYTKSRKKSE